MKSKKYNKIPRYFGLRIYLISTLLYFLLVFPVAGILLFKYIPDFIEKTNSPFSQLRNSPDSKALEATINPHSLSDSSKLDIRYTSPHDTIQPDTAIANQDTNIMLNNTEGGNKISGIMGLLVKLLIASFIMGFIFNLPFKIYFRKVRKQKIIRERLRQFCKTYLLRTPLINTLILFLAYGITILYMVYVLLFRSHIDEVNRQFYVQFLFITIVSSILTLLLVYMCERVI